MIISIMYTNTFEYGILVLKNAYFCLFTFIPV